VTVLSWSLKGLCCAALIGLSAPAALAHKIIASGYAAGDAIEGEVGFSNGDPAKQATLIVTSPDGQRLGEVTTDADGFFRYIPQKAVPHIFTADLGSGHIASFRMEIHDLPRALRIAETSEASTAPVPSATDTPAGAALSDQQANALRDLVAQAVRDEVRPLRRELIASREKASITSILGGLGTILGLVGVGFYMAARRKLAEAAVRSARSPK
jgi:nickel transport protein